MFWQVLCVLLLLWRPLPSNGYGEPDASGRPVYQERANHVFLNAVRIAPSQYITKYMAGYSPSPAGILTAAKYPAVAPLYMEQTLVAAAYYHSNDMAFNGCFSHDSCDGTPTFTRIGSYYTCGGGMGENIAAGNADPLDTNNQWLCDKVGSACAADGSGSDGHRKNIMSSGYKVVGVGYAPNPSSTYRHYWTQDFGGTICNPNPNSPIYGGSHRVKSGLTRFIAVYYTTPATAPSSASVTIDGTTYPLTLDIGAAGRGTYAFEQTAGTACRSYYFTFGTQRYPTTGCLVTYGEGTCTGSFTTTCPSGGAAATTAAATTAAATTAAATTAAATTAAATTAAATTASATTKVATTTTTKTATTTTGTATTGTGSGYYLFTSSLQNGWTFIYNSGVTITAPVSYGGQNALRAQLSAASASSTSFFFLGHTPAVNNVWTTLTFYGASAANGNFRVYFNGYYVQAKTSTTAYQYYSISFSSLGAPATLGNPAQLVFQNTGSTALTLYLYNIQFS